MAIADTEKIRNRQRAAVGSGFDLIRTEVEMPNAQDVLWLRSQFQPQIEAAIAGEPALSRLFDERFRGYAKSLVKFPSHDHGQRPTPIQNLVDAIRSADVRY